MSKLVIYHKKRTLLTTRSYVIKVEMSLIKLTSKISPEFPDGFNEALKTGKSDIQPKNLLVSNSLEAIYRSFTPARLEIFTCLIEKKPNNLTELAQLLERDYANV